MIKRIRSGVRNKGQDLRLVLDLKHKVRPKSFLLKPNAKYGHRLVVDLYPAGKKSTPTLTSRQFESRGGGRDVIVAIDAGHGGEDPGAIGYRGTLEKDVVLKVARRLKREVSRAPGMRPVMIRDGDYFVALRKRIDKARERRADILISIHADAFKDPRARGSSVYVMSADKTSTSETARLLAESENASDLIGGVTLGDKDDLVRTVLLDLSQTATIVSSLDAAGRVLKGLKRLGKVHRRQVEQAGFIVLKAPDIPSMLVETAFISNPKEERNLNNGHHQRRLAKAIFSGVRDYFQENPLPGTRLASSNKYVIKPGDTLSEIASSFNVNLRRLRDANGLRSDTLQVGKVLRIPL